ncbi:GNAT family N-acetyltransferase [Blastococcus xanthinilyticus]|uniref:Putative acetyltransferase n=1 Tax=Blastococcus xanthinilyticus TaxID=1564164 RepID=A0A5S5CUY4_9ACTN|nr:GNAT family N-acetyltransferase [Blastococcus xanthinilyticus]TYP87611.1 putative acetyltransferase [Blastococcus xanthinilyticus]
MTDVDARLRPVTLDEWPAFTAAMHEVFAEEPPADFAERPSSVAELDRSLALWDGDRVVATSGIYSRTLTVPGAVVPCAGVTWVTVAPTHRRGGVLTAIMRRQLTDLHEQQREPVAGLWAAEYPIYGRFGYAPATVEARFTGRSERLRLRPDVDLGTGRVERVSAEEYRPAAVAVREAVGRFVPGTMARDDRWWDRQLRDDPAQRKGATARRYLLHREADGAVTGYAAYRVTDTWTDTGEPDGTLTVEEVRATSTPAYAALWQLLLSIDLVRTVKYPSSSPDDPLRWLITDGRALHSTPVDGLWLRLVDVDRALAARRYPTPIDLVLEVRDPFCPWNDGRWRLSGHPAGGYCARTDRDPDLSLGVEELAAAYLGGVSLATLQAAGRVTEISPGAVTLAGAAFGWPVTPWCPDSF